MYKIKEVLTKKEAKKFTEFPNKMYKNNPYFVPALSIDEMAVFDYKQNPALEYCDAVRYIAYDEKGKMVGRIAGIINHTLKDENNELILRFTRLDMIDDINVTKILFDTLILWGSKKGTKKIIGPMGFTDFDRMGMLVEGFEEMNLSITIYNAPYYQEHLEQLGFFKDVDWLEYQITWPKTVPEKITRVSKLTQKRYGYKLIKLKSKKQIDFYAHKAFKTYNDAFMELYGFHPLNDKLIAYYIKQVKLIVRLDYLWFVLDKDDNVAAFGVIMPSLGKAYKKSNGKLLPLGIFRILRALKKHSVIDFYFIAVDPKHQGKGALSLIMEDAVKVGNKNKVSFAETGPELENNLKIHQQWTNYEPKQHRRRRGYTKSL